MAEGKQIHSSGKDTNELCYFCIIVEDRDQNSLLGQAVQLSTRADISIRKSFFVLTNPVLKIPNNEDFITPFINCIHNLLSFLLFFSVLVANTIMLFIIIIVIVIINYYYYFSRKETV